MPKTLLFFLGRSSGSVGASSRPVRGYPRCIFSSPVRVDKPACLRKVTIWALSHKSLEGSRFQGISRSLSGDPTPSTVETKAGALFLAVLGVVEGTEGI